MQRAKGSFQVLVNYENELKAFDDRGEVLSEHMFIDGY